MYDQEVDEIINSALRKTIEIESIIENFDI